MANEKIRKAFSLAIDRNELIQTFTGGQGAWAFMGALPNAFSQDEIRRVVRYDQAEAKRLLTEAGYPNGLSLEMLFPPKAYGDWFDSTLQLIQVQVKRVGFDVQLNAVETAELSNRRKVGDYQLAGGGTLGLFPDIDSNLFGTYHPSSGNNQSHVDDPKLTVMIEAQRREADPARRQEMIRQAGLYINENAIGQLPLYRTPTGFFWHPYVKGQYPNFADAGTTYTPFTVGTSLACGAPLGVGPFRWH